MPSWARGLKPSASRRNQWNSGERGAGQVRQVVVARQHRHVESGGPTGGHPIGEHADRGDRLAGGGAPVVADVAQEHDPVRAGHGDGPVDGGQDAGGFQVDVADEQDGHLVGFLRQYSCTA